MMSLKRNYQNLEDVTDETSNVELHFGIEILSPVKKSKLGNEYYNAKVSDGTKSLRLVGFDPNTRDKLAQFIPHKTPVMNWRYILTKQQPSQLLHEN